MPHRLAVLAYLALLCALTFVGPKRYEPIDWPEFSEERYFQENWTILRTLKGSYSVVLYEGLPHQTYERKELQNELETKPTVTIDKFPFYREKITLTDADVKKLMDHFDSAELFSPTFGAKACGGFHPDYCLQWITRGGNTVNCLLCFGCSEVQITQGEYSFECDMRTLPVVAILIDYRKDRPQTRFSKRMIDLASEYKNKTR